MMKENTWRPTPRELVAGANQPGPSFPPFESQRELADATDIGAERALTTGQLGWYREFNSSRAWGTSFFIPRRGCGDDRTYKA